MSNIIKMGISTSLKALDIAEIQMPGAIIIGTGIGCIYDTAKFLNQLIENEEDLLNPTSFIQSTHNSVAGQLAGQIFPAILAAVVKQGQGLIPTDFLNGLDSQLQDVAKELGGQTIEQANISFLNQTK